MPEPLLTVKDVAEMLDCSVSTVHRLTEAGILPLAIDERQPGEYRRYRRPDVLEYLAIRRESTQPEARLNAAILSTWPTETARALQTATLTGWAAGQNYAVVSVVYTLSDVLQLIWDGSIEAIIVESLTSLTTPDAGELLTALCAQTGVRLVEAGTTTPAVDPAEQALKIASDALTAMLAPVLGPAEAGRAVEFSLQQWQHVLQQQEQAGDQGASARKRAPAPLGTRPLTPLGR